MKTLDYKYLLLIAVLFLFKIGLSQQINPISTDKFTISDKNTGIIINTPVFTPTPQLPHDLPIKPFNPFPPNPDPIPPRPSPVPLPSGGDTITIASGGGSTEARIMNTSNENSSSFTQLNAYPNPNNGKFTVEFRSNQSGNIKIRLSDITGKEIMNEKIEEFSGNYSNQFDLSNKAKGIYILSIEQNAKQLMKKIVIS